MKDWIYGFFMAWGMFLALPCPLKIWNERARSKMVCCLPLVGLVVGGVWVLAAYAGRFLPPPVAGLLIAAAPWLVTGFLHLDGFMDVCDAVLSRRDLPRRQEILKDSHCGAFAVIGMVLLALSQWSVAMAKEEIPLLPLLAVPVASRACAALAVLTLRPMGTSQYAAMTGKRAPYVAFAAVVMAAAAVVPLALWGSLAPLAAALGYWLAVWYADRQLGGMSGDVSGFSLTLGELCGLAVLTLVR